MQMSTIILFTYLVSILCPLKDGILLTENTSSLFYESNRDKIDIQSNHPEIYSISKGKVIDIKEYSNLKIVLIKDEEKTYVYKGFFATNLIIGDKVEWQEVIGLLEISEGNKYNLTLEIWEGINNVSEYIDIECSKN